MHYGVVLIAEGHAVDRLARGPVVVDHVTAEDAERLHYAEEFRVHVGEVDRGFRESYESQSREPYKGRSSTICRAL